MPDATLHAPAPQVLRIDGRGMLTIRAPEDAAAAVAEAAALQAPAPRSLSRDGDWALAWMSPDERLLMCPPADLPALETSLRDALEGRPHLIVDVSDARAVFRLQGPGARKVLAKGAPVDLAAAAFGPGDFRRTRLGQVACAFWTPDGESFELVCFRSVAEHVGAWLLDAARPGTLPGVL